MPSLVRLFVGESPGMDEAHRQVAVYELVESLESHFGGVTVYPAVGRWEGQSEGTLILESVSLESEAETAATARTVASRAASSLEQDSILMTVQSLGVSELVPGRKPVAEGSV